jgi:hypothetical protein
MLNQMFVRVFTAIAIVAGCLACGPEVTFLEPPPPYPGPPTLTIQPASGITTTTAALNATATPYGARAEVWFEWGPTLEYQTPRRIVNEKTSSLTLSEGLTSLTPNTTYYYRVVAQSSYGTAVGSIKSFLTLPLPTPRVPVVAFTANPVQVAKGGTSTLTWSSVNAVGCSGSAGVNGWVGPRSQSGSFNTGALSATTTFVIVCGDGTSNVGVTASVTIVVTQ